MTRYLAASTGHPRSPVVPACAGLRLHVCAPCPVPRKPGPQGRYLPRQAWWPGTRAGGGAGRKIVQCMDGMPGCLASDG